MKKVVLALILLLILAAVLPLSAFAAATGDKIAILFTGDVGCEIDRGIGYAGVASLKDEAEDTYGKGYVTLVDAGDAINGNAFGAVSKGAYIAELMEAVGYDIAVPGDHEFDYGVEELRRLADSVDYSYLCCNFIDDGTDMTVLSPYEIINYGTVAVGYIGVTTPETAVTHSDVFEGGDAGDKLYSFCQEDGEFYNQVQYTVDFVKAAGVDYVVAVSHLGEGDSQQLWSAAALVENTTGIDILIDGNSKESCASYIYDKNGNQVMLARAGSGLDAVGIVTIDTAKGTLDASVITESAKRDESVQRAVEDAMADFKTRLEATAAVLPVQLESGYTGDMGLLANLGDLCADAYRQSTGTDIAMVNSGNIGKGFKAGCVSYWDILCAQPYGEYLCTASVTGQQILDALEFGAMGYSTQSGNFLYVSGMSYAIDASIPTPVMIDEKGNFAGIVGQRRVRDVLVDGHPIDADETYTLTANEYILKDGGAYTMFDNADAQNCGVKLDVQALTEYIAVSVQNGNMAGYSRLEGDGRIKVYGDGEQLQCEQDRVYVVTGGDNLWSIAEEELGDGARWEEVYELNADAIKRPELIYPGMELIIP